MGLFGLGKKANAVKAEMKKMENRDLMQAVVASAVLVAFADGELEDSEVKGLHEVIEAQPQLSGFGTELSSTIDSYIGTMKASKHLGKIKLMREIEDVKASPAEVEEVFAVAVTIAESDGQIEDAETAVLVTIGRKLGVNLKDYGIAA
jgi:tellurite resistance protein TerB